MNFDFPSAYAGKRVFLTGHTGFKGSWLALWLTQLGAEVVGYAWDTPTDPSHYAVANVRDRLAGEVTADIRDYDRMRAAMHAADPDVVFHLAAQTVVRTGFEIPRETFDINVVGSLCVLDAVRELKKPVAVLMVSSDKCYDNVEQVWGYRECDPMGTHEPYGASKGAMELALKAYHHSFFPPDRIAEHGVKMASLRAGNVIGGGDWTPHALIPDVFAALHKGEPIKIRNPHALRPWQHVLACLSGYMAVGAKLLGDDPARYCTGWNIGPTPGNEIPVHEIADFIVKRWGSGEIIDASDPTAPRESGVLRLAVDKAIWQLGWRPTWCVHEGLEKTIDWFKAYFAGGADMQRLALEQIAAYEKSMQACSIK